MKLQGHSSASVTEAAVEWFLTVCAAEDPPAELVQRWLDWMAASDANRRAFEEVAQVWHGVTPALSERHSDDAPADTYDGSTSVAQWRERSLMNAAHVSHSFPRAATDGREGAPVRAWSRWAAPLAAIAAGAAALVVFFVLQAPWLSRDAAVPAGTFTTRSGEHLNLLLADGSRVTLGAHSRLAVDFTAERRSLWLQAGEAYFLVAKDRGRPFEVRALQGTITATGTAFNVRAIENRVTVTVAEGTVRVAQAGAAPAAPIRLQHGQQVSYRTGDDAAIGPASIERVNAAESARWREGWLVYRDEPLRFVIADVARYAELEFAVSEPAAELKFSGAVFKDRVEEWVAALPEVSPVVVERRGDTVTIDTATIDTATNGVRPAAERREQRTGERP